MLDKNTSGFSALGFEQLHRDGTRMAVIAVRGRFDLDENGGLSISKDQEMILEDEYEGDPHKTPLLLPGDIVPFKPNTDVTALVKSWPPAQTSSACWQCGIKVGENQYIVEVGGPSEWKWTETGWERTEPTPVRNALIDYRIAASDAVCGAPLSEDVPLNPLGVPRLREALLEKGERYPAISIKSPDEVYKLEADHSFEGFGPVPPFWRSRQQYTGTYDERWKAERHPLLPEDFDYRFYQCAHPRLIQKGFLKGDERIELGRVRPGGGNIAFHLPDLVPVAHYQWIDDREVTLRLNLDGVHIDVREPPFRVDLTWRAWLPVCPAFFKIDLSVASLGDAGVSELQTYLQDGFADEEVAA